MRLTSLGLISLAGLIPLVAAQDIAVASFLSSDNSLADLLSGSLSNSFSFDNSNNLVALLDILEAASFGSFLNINSGSNVDELLSLLGGSFDNSGLDQLLQLLELESGSVSIEELLSLLQGSLGSLNLGSLGSLGSLNDINGLNNISGIDSLNNGLNNINGLNGLNSGFNNINGLNGGSVSIDSSSANPNPASDKRQFFDSSNLLSSSDSNLLLEELLSGSDSQFSFDNVGNLEQLLTLLEATSLGGFSGLSSSSSVQQLLDVLSGSFGNDSLEQLLELLALETGDNNIGDLLTLLEAELSSNGIDLNSILNGGLNNINNINGFNNVNSLNNGFNNVNSLNNGFNNINNVNSNVVSASKRTINSRIVGKRGVTFDVNGAILN